MVINIKTLLKLFLIPIKIVSVTLGMTILGCQRDNQVGNNPMEKEELLFKNEIEKDLSIFKKYDSINYVKNSNYMKAIKLCKEADNLIKGNFAEDSVMVFCSHLNEYCHTSNYSLYYKNFEKADISTKIFKIRSFQTIAVNSLLNNYKNVFYPMELVKPILVPRKSILKMGEKYIADVYLVGNNTTNRYVVLINNDTLKYKEGENFPEYQEIPKTKGEKTVNATMKIYHPNLNTTFEYNFSDKYVVQ
jgi:hypothetical protein